MKKALRASIIVMTVLIISTFLCIQANAKSTDTYSVRNTGLVSYSSTDNLNIYNDIYSAITNLENKLDLGKYNRASGDVFSILDSVLYDHPEIFYVDQSKCSYWSDGLLEIGYGYSNSIIEADRKRLEDTADTIINTLITPDMTEFEKEKAIHDYIVMHTTYDEDNYQKGTIPPESYTAYGILINHTGVCEGYSRAMKLLLNKVGIDCDIIISEQINHAWNLVKIDGSWFHLDSTWDDPVPDTGKIYYKYFNLSDSKISEDHIWDKSRYVQCSSEKFSYMREISYLIQDGEWFYYSSESDDNILYKIRIDGTGRQKVCDDRAQFICSYGEWLYYSNYSYGGYIFKIKKDGTGRKQLNSVYSTDLYIKDGNLYFKDNDTGKLNFIGLENIITDTTPPEITMSSKGGIYSKAQTLTVSLSEEGSVYYTTNGSTPSVYGNKYSGPITIGSSMIIKLIAVDKAGNISKVYDGVYIIDNSGCKLFGVFPGQQADKKWTVKFNTNIDISTANENTFKVLDLSENKYIGINIEVNKDGKSVIVSPKAGLITDRIYYLIVDSGVKSPGGVNLSKPAGAYFTVKY